MSVKTILTLASLSFVTLFSPAMAYDLVITEGDYAGWSFNKNSDGSYSVAYVEPEYLDGSIVIPANIEVSGQSVSVSGIDSKAYVSSTGNGVFSSSKLTKVTIKSGVSQVGSSAFAYCTNLKTVTLEKGVKVIGDYAFAGCSRLTGVEIPEGVTEIGQSAFAYCERMTTVSLPSTLKSIGTYAFNACEKLDGVELPSGLETLGSFAFCQCKALTSITIPASVSTISQGAFQFCYSLANVTIEDSKTNTNRVIEQCAFNQCNMIESITIPGSISTIESKAFQDCKNLKTVVIADGVDNIEDYAFDSCNELLTVQFETKSLETLPTFKDHSFTYWKAVQNGQVDFVAPDDADYVIDVKNGVLSVNKKTSDPTAIKNKALSAQPVAYYALTGAKLTAPKSGVVIVVYSDGTREKVLFK